jgi:hypothetical protein
MDTVNYQKEIPIRWKCDVAVIGGGIAGVCAACAAANSGASVILVERFATTGGMMTNGGVKGFCGETAGQGEVFDTIISMLEGFGAIESYQPYNYETGDNRQFKHGLLSVVLQEILLRRGVKLLLHTRFVDVIMADNGQISTVVLRGQSGPEALLAKQFIDCTGEAEVAFLGGGETMKGRSLDGLQLPMSLNYFVREVAAKDRNNEVPEGLFEKINKSEDLPMTSIWPNDPIGKEIKIKIIGFDSTDTESLSQAEIMARQRMMQVLDYHQRIDKKNWLLDYVSPIIGIREGRRIVGDYILTEDDVRTGKVFEDGIAVGTYYIDAHDPTTDKRVAQIHDFNKRKVSPYQIPLRSLIARDFNNLWMAGRNFSSDYFALGSARVATSAAMMGQAAGIAATIAATEDCHSREIDSSKVQKIVLERKANLDLCNRPTSI